MVKRLVLAVLAVCFVCSPSLFAITRTWTGAVSANWSAPANWSPSGTPASGDLLVFPPGVSRTTMTNDLPSGTAVGSIAIDGVYSLGGNPLTLTGDITGSSMTLYADMKLGGDVSITGAYFEGAVDINGQTLTAHYSMFEGPINGDGTIISAENATLPMMIGNGVGNGSGNFSGTITGGGVEFAGTLPNATLDVELLKIEVSGSTLGDVTITPSSSGYVTPGGLSGSVLHTKSFALQGGLGFSVLVGQVGTGLIQATGTVTLNGPLKVGTVGPYPSLGQQVTIIDNDGSDAVSGTFTGLPEGATFTLESQTLSISYHGGDGNDVVLTDVPKPGLKTWTGTNSGNWSNPANWSPSGAPAPADTLVFPLGATHTTMNNDLSPGAAVGKMMFNDNYTLTGNELTLMGDIAGSLNSNVSLKVGNPLTISSGFYSGPIDVNGQTLTLTGNALAGTFTGSGSIVSNPLTILYVGTGNFSGSVTGWVNIDGSAPNMDVIGSATGDGTLGDVTIDTGVFYPRSQLGGPAAAAVIHSKSLTLRTKSSSSFAVSGSGVSTSVQVTGTVTLNGTLSIRTCGSSAAGAELHDHR